MTWPTEPSLDVAVIRGRARAERARADRAANTAGRHESLQDTASTEAMRAFHERMAALHRRLADRHRTAARLHERYANRIDNWAAYELAQAGSPPAFLEGVAAELGSPSAGVTLLGPNRAVASMIASGPLASAAQRVEFDLGEGPAHEATRTVLAVIARVDEPPGRWPLYCPAVSRLGLRSVAAVPLTDAATCVGALTVFDTASAQRLAGLLPRLTVLADALTHTMLLSGRPAVPSGPAGPLLRDQELHPVTHQAAGMVAAQCRCTPEDALALIRARAFAANESVDTIARRVVRRELRLDDRGPE